VNNVGSVGNRSDFLKAFSGPLVTSLWGSFSVDIETMEFN